MTDLDSEEHRTPRTWKRQISSGAELLLGIGLLVLFVIGSLWLLHLVISWVSRIGQVLPAEGVVLLCLAAGVLILWALQRRNAVTEQLRRDLRDRRAGVYREVVKFYLEIMLWEKLGKEPKTEEEVIRFHARVTPQLLMWASDPVIKRYAQLRNQTLEEETNSVDLIFEFEKLFLAMRKDLGHSNRGLCKGDVLSLFVNDITQYVNPLDVERVE